MNWWKKKGGFDSIVARIMSTVPELTEEEYAEGDSPIEKMFYLAFQLETLIAFGTYDIRLQYKDEQTLDQALEPQPYDTRIPLVVTPQYQLGKFRVDFLLSAHSIRGQIIQCVIECDGHEWHERTKVQAARDCGRDRTIQMAGLHIFRFTGAEIWKDACGCARQILRWMDHQVFDNYGIQKVSKK